jgi:hypothetical protein
MENPKKNMAKDTKQLRQLIYLYSHAIRKHDHIDQRPLLHHHIDTVACHFPESTQSERPLQDHLAALQGHISELSLNTKLTRCNI